jgi:hypothetical protein
VRIGGFIADDCKGQEAENEVISVRCFTDAKMN